VLDCLHDLLEHSVRISKNVGVPEAQGTKAAITQVGIARLISCTVSVLTAIRFNDEHLFERHEVDNPRSDGHLPAKFGTCKLPRTEELPELLFCVCQHVRR